MVGQWNGIAGVYVYDLAGDEVVASLNQDSVFSGASVMKVPILLYSYIKLKTFDEDQEKWLKKMIVDSDNLSANQMLAASAGGSGTEDALVGALDMSEMLKDLGLEHTYQNMPYEASDYLIKVRGFKIKRGPEREGPAPHTEADPVLRTTPAEMSQIFLWIDQCSRGTGVLLERFSSSLTAARCREMIDRLEQNGDHTRMLAGFPDDTRVAHKSGWIEDMQADVGIVRSPGADFVLAIYLYRDIIPGKTYLADEIAAPVIADVARLVYTYYNPVRPLE
jgi:beta-lactamase class A